MENIKEFLLSVGIGKNEAEIYSTLVEQGTSSVLEIAKRTKLHRSNIYDDLRKLIKRGLVFKINEPTTLFYARPPSSLNSYLKQKEIELGELVKDYEKIISTGKQEEAKVKLSQGIFAAREAIFNMLNLNQTILVYGIPKHVPETLGVAQLAEFHKQRIAKKIEMKHIYNSDAFERASFLNKMKYTETRVLPAKYDSEVTTLICDDRVVLLLWGKDTTVIEIVDRTMAIPYQNYFDILWKRAQPFAKKSD